MTDLNLYNGGVPARQPKQVARAYQSLSNGTDFSVRRVDAQAQIEEARIDAMGSIGRAGIQAIGMLSQYEMAVAQAVPLAGTRVEQAGSMATVCIMNLLAGATTRLNRL